MSCGRSVALLAQLVQCAMLLWRVSGALRGELWSEWSLEEEKTLTTAPKKEGLEVVRSWAVPQTAFGDAWMEYHRDLVDKVAVRSPSRACGVPRMPVYAQENVQLSSCWSTHTRTQTHAHAGHT